MFRLGSLFAVLVVLLGLPARALEVRQTLWGFDGRAVPGRFNPVSLLLANPGARPFDSEVALEESRGLNGRDAEVAQAIYLAPQQERWVQFQIFVRENTEFRLNWGRGAKEGVEIPSPASAPPARVLLTDPANPFSAGAGLRAFPDDLFPTSVAATDGLDAVALDYMPRWEAARRGAFLDWLQRGGLVLLLHGPGGAYPVFDGDLAVLNFDGDSARVGSGTVLRQPATRRDASEKLLADRGFPAREIKTNKQPAIYDLERTFFDRLTSLTRPRVNWWLLNSFAFVYLLLVGPLHYRWAKRIDYRTAIALFVGTVALFGWLFAVVGRRGYGESQTVHSLTIARALGGGRCDAMQWISAFATRGDLYALSHESPASYYSAVPQADTVRGRIYQGREGRFLIDIPLYSARPFVHRAVLQGDDTGVTIEKWETGPASLKEFVVKPGPGFPQGVSDLQVRYRERLYPLTKNGDRWTLAGGTSDSIENSLRADVLRPLPITRFGDDDKRSAETKMRQMLPLLQARALGGTEGFQQSLPERPLPPEQAQLWIFAPAPAGFRVRGEGFTNELGLVLYVQDLFRP
jgi:hypothetical protein